MNWWRHPELLDRLAGEYTVGTLHGGARRRFEAVMTAHPVVAQAVARWAQQLQPLDAQLQPLPADDALWQRIEGRLFGAPRGGPTVAAAAASSDPWWRRWLGGRPAAALAFGLVAGLALPTLMPLLNPPSDETQLPESYVGVLATAQGKPGLIVSSLRRGRTLDLKLLQPQPLPAGQRWVLWTLDAQGRPQAVTALAALQPGFSSVQLPQASEALFSRAVELAFSVEPADAAGGRLPEAPSQPYAYRGLCGKLWKVAPVPTPSPAASR